MKIILPEQMNYQNIQIEKIASFEQKWNENSVFSTVGRTRNKSGLMLLSGCDAVCKMRDETIYGNRGDILYLPPHCEYTTEFVRVTESPADCLLDLWLTENGEEIALSHRVMKVGGGGIFGTVAEIFQQIHMLLESPIPNLCMAKAQAYRLLAHIGSAKRKGELKKGRFSMIEKGIRYLEEDPLQEKSMEEVAKMCHVSSGCFRRLFSEYAGVAPSVYRIQRKIEKARLLLESGRVSVSETSEQLGFSDVAYFSRIFKKYTGKSPKQYLP